MDATQEAHWREKGWVVVAGVLSSQTVRAMNEIYDAHLAGSAPDMHPEDRGWDGVSLHESVLKRIHVAAGVT